MKAIVQDRFGPPEVLRLADIGRPEIGPGDVLVRVRAAGLNPYDWHMLRGDPLIARLIPNAVGLTRPKYRVAGLDAAGVVEEDAHSQPRSHFPPADLRVTSLRGAAGPDPLVPVGWS